MASVRPSQWSDVITLSSNLREADLAELEALGTSPRFSLAHGFINSAPPYTIVTDEDKPIGMFGVVPMGDTAGAIWLLGTDHLVTAAKLPFLRECRAWVERLQEVFEVLTNIVDARNLTHIHWLGWCGFKFIREVTINDHTFIQFERRASV